MEFGSQQCKAVNPECEICPLQESCVAFSAEIRYQITCETQKSKKKNLYFDYFYIENQGNTYLKKRTEKGIWQNLYDFPLSKMKKRRMKKKFSEKYINF